MQCPRCVVNLSEEQHGGVKLHFCPGCQGMWLLRQNLEEVVQSRKKSEVLKEAGKPEAVHRDTGKVIRCPAGGHAPMKRKFSNNIYMDLCKEHGGVWLDGGELEYMRYAYHEMSWTREERQGSEIEGGFMWILLWMVFEVMSS